MRVRLIFALLALVALLSSCGDEEHFRINGTIEGKPTMNLRLAYVSEGVYKPAITAAREGEFKFEGSAPYGAVLEIYDYDYRLLGRTYVANGQDIDISLDRYNPWSIRVNGNDIGRQWADFLRDNMDLYGDVAAVNEAIAEYIGEHPDNMVSTLLLMTSYDASANAVAADSLLELIEPAARPAALTDGFNYLLQRMLASETNRTVTSFRYMDRRDSLLTFRPSDAELSLLVFDNNRTGRRDSIVPALKSLHRHNDRLKIVEFSFDADTVEWKRSTRQDTASWSQAWAAGGFAGRGMAQFSVPSMPFFIVCDSTGRTLLRTPSATHAADSVNAIIARNQ